MATTESSALAHPYTPVPEEAGDLEHVGSGDHRALKLSGRLQRGMDLALERFEEITRIAPWTWSVPSCSGEGSYVVDLKHTTCTCPDHPPEPERCKHVSAAAYVKAKTALCHGCGFRKRHRELYEVGEGNLTFFAGDLLCKDCARSHGVL